MEKLNAQQKRLKIINYTYLTAALSVGVIVFGIIFPGSLSDHYHLLHFSAHFGMSFLIAYSIYRFCTLRALMRKTSSVALALAIVLTFGIIYKFIEIFGFYGLQDMPFFSALTAAGFYASMSQNFSGILAAFALIIYFDNLIPVRKYSKL